MTNMETQKNMNTTNHNTNHSSTRNTGGRPRTAKGKARTKTLSTKLSVAEWKIVMKRIADAGKRPSAYLREQLLSRRVVAARTQEDRRQIRMLEGGCTFSGSRIDRAMSYYALDRQLNGRMLGAGEQRLSAGSEQYRQRFAELAQRGQLVAPKFGNNSITTDSRQSAATYTEGDSHTPSDSISVVSDAGNAADNIDNIIQITVATFIELAVQPHQVRISSGGGGGSDRDGWNDKDKDKEKNEYRPRRRR